MSRDSWNIDNGPLRSLYRDRENGWIFGVCAGIAGTVRVLAVLSLCLFFWAAAAIYIGLTLLIREKPLVYSGRRAEYEFWRKYRDDGWRHL